MATPEEKKKFAYQIDLYAASSGLSYLESIVEYCASIDMEIELAASLINNNLKEKIEWEATESRQIKNVISSLPL